jgi:hypothetical protein
MVCGPARQLGVSCTRFDSPRWPGPYGRHGQHPGARRRAGGIPEPAVRHPPGPGRTDPPARAPPGPASPCTRGGHPLAAPMVRRCVRQPVTLHRIDIMAWTDNQCPLNPCMTRPSIGTQGCRLICSTVTIAASLNRCDSTSDCLWSLKEPKAPAAIVHSFYPTNSSTLHPADLVRLLGRDNYPLAMRLVETSDVLDKLGERTLRHIKAMLEGAAPGAPPTDDVSPCNAPKGVRNRQPLGRPHAWSFECRTVCESFTHDEHRATVRRYHPGLFIYRAFRVRHDAICGQPEAPGRPARALPHRVAACNRLQGVYVLCHSRRPGSMRWS